MSLLAFVRLSPVNFNSERSAGRRATLVSVVCAWEAGSAVASATLASLHVASSVCDEDWATTAAKAARSSSVTALRRPARDDAWKCVISGSRWYGCKVKMLISVSSQQVMRMHNYLLGLSIHPSTFISGNKAHKNTEHKRTRKHKTERDRDRQER